MAGTLYIVATPIGNLEDITHRAVRVLAEADLIACEDTRQTRKLLSRYGIEGRVVSHHEHNERGRAAELIREMEAGRSVALVSDAGTPLIADPGYRIVHEARERGIAVVPIPGPSAIVAGLSASGLPTDSFCFLGFLPAKAAQRRRVLESVAQLQATVVFFEAPHRILQTLDEIGAVLGARVVVLGRELTKIHEEFLTGTPEALHAELSQRAAIKGEFTLMVAKAAESSPPEEQSIEDEVAKLVEAGTPRMEAMKAVARRFGLSKREIYRRVADAGRAGAGQQSTEQ